MGWRKWIEIQGKWLGAALARVLLHRPWRSARIEAPRRVLLVRTDRRVGEALLTTPLLATLKALPSAPRVDLLVHPGVARVLVGHPDCDEVLSISRGALWLGPWGGVLRDVRRRAYDVIVDCGNWTAPSLSNALIARLASPHGVLLGPAARPAGWLHDVPVAPLPGARSEVVQRLNLLSPLPGYSPRPTLSFRTARVRPELGPLLEQRGRPFAVVNPGGRLGERRVPIQAFAAATAELLRRGLRPLVTWGPGEEALAAELLSLAPGARLAPPTDLDDLATLMRAAALTFCNNTGPMHLSVAVGTPTFAVFLRIDPERWGHRGHPHRICDVTPIVEGSGSLAERVTTELSAWLDEILAPSPPAGRSYSPP